MASSTSGLRIDWCTSVIGWRATVRVGEELEVSQVAGEDHCAARRGGRQGGLRQALRILDVDIVASDSA